MGTRTGESFVALDDEDGRDAADRLVDAAVEDLGKDSADFAMLFCSKKFDVDGLVGRVDERLTEIGAEWIGGTTAGEISKAGSTIGGAVLFLLSSDEMDIYTGAAEELYEDPVDAGRRAVREALPEAFPRKGAGAVFTVIAGFTVEQPGAEFDVLKGVTREVDVPVVGGSTGDDARFQQTFQFYDGEIHEDTVVVAALDTELSIHTGKEHGFERKVKSGTVSSADGRVIEEVNGRPAAAFYADAIGVSVEELRETFEAPTGTELPMILRYSLENGLAEEITPGNLRLITPIDVTEDGGLVMTVEVDENRPFHVVQGETENVIAAARDAFSHVDVAEEEPVFGIVSDCACRNMSLSSEQLDREVRMLREEVGAPVVGFYGYGEIGGTDEGFCTFQNQTVSGLLVTRG